MVFRRHAVGDPRRVAILMAINCYVIPTPTKFAPLLVEELIIIVNDYACRRFDRGFILFSVLVF